jgi:hypothetical protein
MSKLLVLALASLVVKVLRSVAPVLSDPSSVNPPPAVFVSEYVAVYVVFDVNVYEAPPLPRLTNG